MEERERKKEEVKTRKCYKRTFLPILFKEIYVSILKNGFNFNNTSGNTV